MSHTIKFSHHYLKMNRVSGFEKSKLLAVFRINLKDLSKDFRNYDTSFYNSDAILEQYPLPESGDYLVLLLLSERGDLWTTIRSEKFGKFQYYNDQIGKTFDCIIKEEE